MRTPTVTPTAIPIVLMSTTDKTSHVMIPISITHQSAITSIANVKYFNAYVSIKTALFHCLVCKNYRTVTYHAWAAGVDGCYSSGQTPPVVSTAWYCIVIDFSYLNGLHVHASLLWRLLPSCLRHEKFLEQRIPVQSLFMFVSSEENIDKDIDIDRKRTQDNHGVLDF